MKKFALLTTAGLLLSLQVNIAAAASVAAGQRAIEAKDYAKALTELQPLAKEGDPKALNLLGQMYENGWGVKADANKAKQYYEQGARQGNLESVNNLRALKNKAYKKEFDARLPSAKAGDATAQNRIGEMYEFGQGVKRDTKAAFEWYSKAADQGYVPAWHNLGRCYNFGSGVAQNYDTAETWYQKAAKHGDKDAMFFLGTLYATNHGRDTSNSADIISYAWLKNAADAGNQTAATIEDRMKMKLNPEQLKQAQALAEQYKSQIMK